MKKLFIFLFVFLFLYNFSNGQKFGVVDSELVLNMLDDYKKVQKEIDKIAIKEQIKIEKLFSQLDSLNHSYQRDEILMTEEMKIKRKNEINSKHKSIKTYQRKIFGFEGLIFLKRQELIKPVQIQVFDAVKKVAKKHKLQFVFDKAADLTLIYSSPVHDYTDYVLEELKEGDPTDTIDNKRTKIK